MGTQYTNHFIINNLRKPLTIFGTFHRKQFNKHGYFIDRKFQKRHFKDRTVHR